MKAFATAKLVSKYWKKSIFVVSLYMGYNCVVDLCMLNVQRGA